MKFKHLDIIKNMTLEQKASLMSGKDFWQTQEIEELGIPSIFLALELFSGKGLIFFATSCTCFAVIVFTRGI